MLIGGAGGHAVEILEVITSNNYRGDIVFFDDISKFEKKSLFNRYKILTTTQEAAVYLKSNPDFCIGIGNPRSRQLLEKKLRGLNGNLVSIISNEALIGQHEVMLGKGLNIMQGAIITSTTRIGNGCLIHVNASVHHNTIIGEYCELSPGCRILGGAVIESFASIGSNAVILRNITIGKGAVIGAGAVVTKDVPECVTMVGVPAKKVSMKISTE